MAPGHLDLDENGSLGPGHEHFRGYLIILLSYKLLTESRWARILKTKVCSVKKVRANHKTRLSERSSV